MELHADQLLILLSLLVLPALASALAGRFGASRRASNDDTDQFGTDHFSTR